MVKTRAVLIYYWFLKISSDEDDIPFKDIIVVGALIRLMNSVKQKTTVYNVAFFLIDCVPRAWLKNAVQ